MPTSSVDLTGDAVLTVAAAPAPVVTSTTGILRRRTTTTTGGVIGVHASIASATQTFTRYTAAGVNNHAMSSAALAVTQTASGGGNTALFGGAVLNITAPVSPFSIPNELTYFLVTGTWYDVESPDPSANTNYPLYQIISGFVTFYPRVPSGFTAIIENLDNGSGVGADTAVAFPPIGVRIMHGQLSTINRNDTPGIQLVANTSFIQSALETIDPKWLDQNNLAPGQLVYDVKFTNVVYAEAGQIVSNFGFTAPTDNTQICITDPGIERLIYGGP